MKDDVAVQGRGGVRAKGVGCREKGVVFMELRV
jgi:hypothetical protein